MTRPFENQWQKTAARKKQERDDKIPPQWRIPADMLPPPGQCFVEHWPRESGLLTENELRITETVASEIVLRVAAGEWTSEQVTTAVCKRTAIVQQLVNCVTEVFFEEAIARARALDDHFRRTGKVIGPLHGLPISLKDQFNIKGLDSTIGYISGVAKPATSDSTLVALLRSAGAVLYVKTNVPTTLMMSETTNYLFGRTLNPRNRALTPGGSSGGESALIASRGSPLGVGTDIGGSIRNPCAWTGLWGLRPSAGRVPCRDITSSLVGQEAVRTTAGPMCRHPSDIRLFMSTVAAAEPWLRDSDVLPMPWRTDAEQLPETLCFGVAWHDGYVQASPPLRRALEMTAAKLRAAGHRVVEFIPRENVEASRLAFKMWSADGGSDVQRSTAATGEPLPEQIEVWMGKSSGLKPLATSEIWGIQTRRGEMAAEWMERWNATVTETGTGRPIDGLIVPSTPLPAPQHGQPFPWGYASLSPVLDLTTGVFPVTKVDMEKDIVSAGWKPLSKRDAEIRALYGKPQNHENALVGLALIGRRLEEEKITAMLQMLHGVVGTDYTYGDDWEKAKREFSAPYPML